MNCHRLGPSSLAAAFACATAPCLAAQETPAATPVPARASAPSVDLSTPEKTLQSLLDAFLRKDMAAMVACVVGAKMTPEAREMENELKRGEPFPFTRLIVTNSKSLDSSADAVTLTFGLSAAGPGFTTPRPLSNVVEKVRLRREAGEWRVVLPPLEELKESFASGPRGVEQMGMTLNVAIIASYPKVFLAARMAARGANSLSNVKQICLGLMMLSQDYDDKFMLKASTYKASLIPYIRNEKVFTSPLDKPGTLSYQFNPKLAGLVVAKIMNPAQTVMVYEGAWGKPLFRYAGRAVIGFADGRAKLVTPAEAKSLRWTP